MKVFKSPKNVYKFFFKLYKNFNHLETEFYAIEQMSENVEFIILDKNKLKSLNIENLNELKIYVYKVNELIYPFEINSLKVKLFFKTFDKLKEFFHQLGYETSHLIKCDNLFNMNKILLNPQFHNFIFRPNHFEIDHAIYNRNKFFCYFKPIKIDKVAKIKKINFRLSREGFLSAALVLDREIYNKNKANIVITKDFNLEEGDLVYVDLGYKGKNLFCYGPVTQKKIVEFKKVCPSCKEMLYEFEGLYYCLNYNNCEQLFALKLYNFVFKYKIKTPDKCLNYILSLVKRRIIFNFDTFFKYKGDDALAKLIKNKFKKQVTFGAFLNYLKIPGLTKSRIKMITNRFKRWDEFINSSLWDYKEMFGEEVGKFVFKTISNNKFKAWMKQLKFHLSKKVYFNKNIKVC